MNHCKICDHAILSIVDHTANCGNCGALLFYPYPLDEDKFHEHEDKELIREIYLSWYTKSSFNSHTNFTNMLRYMMDDAPKDKKLSILDYGGGGGQFALVCKSHFPLSEVYIVDLRDSSLLEEYNALNKQIQFSEFELNKQKFDYIFLNDVFEHVSNPLEVINLLSKKLNLNGQIFIDTPRQFWLYPALNLISKKLYKKLLRGTVSTSHLQIWSKKSFEYVIKQSNLKICKYDTISEYTMPADFYLKNMGVTNSFLLFVGRIFYKCSKWLAANKIIAVLKLDC